MDYEFWVLPNRCSVLKEFPTVVQKASSSASSTAARRSARKWEDPLTQWGHGGRTQIALGNKATTWCSLTYRAATVRTAAPVSFVALRLLKAWRLEKSIIRSKTVSFALQRNTSKCSAISRWFVNNTTNTFFQRIETKLSCQKRSIRQLLLKMPTVSFKPPV